MRMYDYFNRSAIVNQYDNIWILIFRWKAEGGEEEEEWMKTCTNQEGLMTEEMTATGEWAFSGSVILCSRRIRKKTKKEYKTK